MVKITKIGVLVLWFQYICNLYGSIENMMEGTNFALQCGFKHKSLSDVPRYKLENKGKNEANSKGYWKKSAERNSQIEHHSIQLKHMTFEFEHDF